MAALDDEPLQVGAQGQALHGLVFHERRPIDVDDKAGAAGLLARAPHTAELRHEVGRLYAVAVALHVVPPSIDSEPNARSAAVDTGFAMRTR
jgi:hypothetical protein